jgi:Transglutaminase-like superfamily
LDKNNLNYCSVSVRKHFIISLFFIYACAVQAQDVVAKKVPRIIQRSPRLCAEYLTQGFIDDKQKAIAIGAWIGTNIKYDIKRWRNSSVKRYSVKRVMKRKKALCGEYAELYKAMLGYVNIPAVVVDGNIKDFMYNVHDEFYRVGHAWNAVYADGKWYLADLTFASGTLKIKKRVFYNRIRRIFRLAYVPGKFRFEQRLSFNYFFNEPEIFMFNHIPADPVWYLTEQKPISAIEQDSSYYYNRSKFDSQNKWTEEGVVCADCFERSAEDPYHKEITEGREVIEYNYKDEEFAIMAKIARADSILKFVERTNEVSDEMVDSLLMAETWFRDAAYYLRCHGKNLRHEYSYLIKKEKRKLEYCKNENASLKKGISGSRKLLGNLNSYLQQRRYYVKAKSNALRQKGNESNARLEPKTYEKENLMSMMLDRIRNLNSLHAQFTTLNNSQVRIVKSVPDKFLPIREKLPLVMQEIAVATDYRQYYMDDYLLEMRELKKKLINNVNTQNNAVKDVSQTMEAYKKAVNLTDSVAREFNFRLRETYKIFNTFLAEKGSNLRSDSVYSVLRKMEKLVKDRSIEVQDSVYRYIRAIINRVEVNQHYFKREYYLFNQETRSERYRAKAIIKFYARKVRRLQSLNVQQEKNINRSLSRAKNETAYMRARLSEKKQKERELREKED